MFAEREKRASGKAKIGYKRERVYLVFATKLQKVFGKKSMQRGKLGLGKEEGLFFSRKERSTSS